MDSDPAIRNTAVIVPPLPPIIYIRFRSALDPDNKREFENRLSNTGKVVIYICGFHFCPSILIYYLLGTDCQNCENYEKKPSPNDQTKCKEVATFIKTNKSENI
jgi:hypothetical protein